MGSNPLWISKLYQSEPFSTTSRHFISHDVRPDNIECIFVFEKSIKSTWNTFFWSLLLPTIRLVTRFPCLYLFVIIYFLPSTYYNTMHEHGILLLIPLKILIMEKKFPKDAYYNSLKILPLTIKYTIESIQAPFKQMVTLSENQMK